MESKNFANITGTVKGIITESRMPSDQPLAKFTVVADSTDAKAHADSFMVICRNNLADDVKAKLKDNARIDITGQLHIYAFSSDNSINTVIEAKQIDLYENEMLIASFKDEGEFCSTEFEIVYVPTGEHIRWDIHEDDHIRTSYFLELLEKTPVGQIMEVRDPYKYDTFYKFLVKKKGKDVLSGFNKVTNTDVKTCTNCINYTFFYNPRTKYKPGYSSDKIIHGLKCNPNDKKFNLEYFKMFLNKLNKITSDNTFTMLCMIPGHLASDENTGTINKLIEEANLVKQNRLINGSQALIRFADAPQQKYIKGTERTIDAHLNTIRVALPAVSGQDILLLDDVVTSGSSMYAAQELLLEAGAKSVTCYAFAMAHSQWIPTPSLTVDSNINIDYDDEEKPF